MGPSLRFTQLFGFVILSIYLNYELLFAGQQIHAFQGHVKKITSCCFNSNGFQIVTGGTDNTVRIWDLRKKKCSYILPAHNQIISDVRLSASGELLASASFDGTVKVWGTRDFR